MPGLRAFQDGDKEHTFVGLYLGTGMTTDFNKDKGVYKTPTLFKGTLRRSTKHPTKKLVLEMSSGGSLPPLQELAGVLESGEAHARHRGDEGRRSGAGADARRACRVGSACTRCTERSGAVSGSTHRPCRRQRTMPNSRRRLQGLMPRVQDAGTFNAEIPKKAAEATHTSLKDPSTAMRHWMNSRRSLRSLARARRAAN